MNLQKKILFEYDTEVKTGYIHFNSPMESNESEKQIELEDQENQVHIILDISKDNELNGIELLSIPELPKIVVE